MGRHRDPETEFRLGIHTVGGRPYASTYTAHIDPVTGKRSLRRFHWGKLDEDLKFIPGDKYLLATPEERHKLIVPESWDMSEANKLTGLRPAGKPAYEGEDRNSLYGDVWLMEQVAMKTGLRQDLETVFKGDTGVVDDVMTLAMYPYLSGLNYNHVAQWQSYVKAPSSRELTPSAITRLSQSIKEEHRMCLLKLRAARLGKEELCAVDSTSVSAYGDGLTDVLPGDNKEKLQLDQTVESVIYSLTSHIPVYYRQFPGNMTDARTLSTILTDIEHKGFKDLIFTTDRGYESIQNLELYILRNKKFITGARTNTTEILNLINEIGEFSGFPKTMEFDPKTKYCFKQYPKVLEVEGRDGTTKLSDRLTINLYFDENRRIEKLKNIMVNVFEQRQALDEHIINQIPISNEQKSKLFSFFIVNTDPISNIVESYEENIEKIKKEERRAGFFAIKSHKIDLSAMEIYNIYHRRDEQEKFFTCMKTYALANRQRCSSDDGKEWRLFINFISLIMISYIRHIWESTELKKIFPTTYDIIMEMRPIRCIEHTHRSKKLTPFVGKQLHVCKAFGIDIPEGCAPAFPSRQITKCRRGRRPRRPVEQD